jgi:hypothetical protein
MNARRIRKQVSDLTDEDSSLSAVWEFALEDGRPFGRMQCPARCLSSGHHLPLQMEPSCAAI